MAKKKDDPSVYTGQYDEAVNRLANEYASSNYGDFTRGQDYADLAARYARNGQMAMKDTLGQVSARTGGLASSYATAAAANSYNDYMSKLEDAARSMYDSQQAERANKLGIMRQAANDEYGRYTDALDRDLTERKFAYTQQQDALDRDFNERKFAYSQEQDAYSRQQTAQKNAQALIQTYLQNGIDPSKIDPDILSASGYTIGTIQNLKDSFDSIAAYVKDENGNVVPQYVQENKILNDIDKFAEETKDMTETGKRLAVEEAIDSGRFRTSSRNDLLHATGLRGIGETGYPTIDYLKQAGINGAISYIDKMLNDGDIDERAGISLLLQSGYDLDEITKILEENEKK